MKKIVLISVLMSFSVFAESIVRYKIDPFVISTQRNLENIEEAELQIDCKWISHEYIASEDDTESKIIKEMTRTYPLSVNTSEEGYEVESKKFISFKGKYLVPNLLLNERQILCIATVRLDEIELKGSMQTCRTPFYSRNVCMVRKYRNGNITKEFKKTLEKILK